MRHFKSIRVPATAIAGAIAAAVLLTLCAGASVFADSRAPLLEQGGLLGTITGNSGTSQQATAVPTIAVTVITPTPAATTVPTATIVLTATAVTTATTAPAAADDTIVANPEGIIEGTVVANRSDAVVRFFVEGNTWQLDPQRSTGLDLSRPTAVLNLFNCDANTADQADCFWDPYLLERDGFFEIVPGAEEDAQVSLVLRAAGAPPTNQIWIQNRSGVQEQIYFGAQMVDLQPASVQEFNIDPATPSVFYLRTCVDGADAPVCEWTARDALPGTYYALVSESWQSGLPGVTVTDTQLAPVLGAEVAAAATPVAATAPTTGTAAAPASVEPSAPVAAAESATVSAAATGGIVCRLAVPTLNVRSGPGLEFAVISKIMTTGETPATVTVVGRTEAGDWLQVDERQANGGWIINGDAYVTCDASTATLAAVPASLLPATPTPDPAAIAALPVQGGESATTGDGSTENSADAPTGDGVSEVPVATVPDVPAGLAQVVVQNSFEQPLRFTLDQRYRVAEGPSEVDLAPGQSTSFIVYPGVVAFSASSAWRNLSGNAEILLEGDQQRALYLIFVPDPGEEGKWIFQY